MAALCLKTCGETRLCLVSVSARQVDSPCGPQGAKRTGRGPGAELPLSLARGAATPAPPPLVPLGTGPEAGV